MFGSTMGHQHLQAQDFNDGRRFQEIYEFLGYGGMLIRNSEGTTLYFLRPNEKIVVGKGDNMTIFNFSEGKLMTHDYANHDKNKANKNTEDNIGSLLAGKFTPGINGLTFYVNEDYRRNGLITGRGPLVYLNCGLGEDLFDYVAGHPDCFDEIGIRPVIGGNLPEDLKKEFSMPLLELVQKRNQTLFDALWMDSDILHGE